MGLCKKKYGSHKKKRKKPKNVVKARVDYIMPP